ncbi:MAG: hypothetical protein HC797_08950, partial [Anaerolineales bacterium]|nr:hypothetical protein [Anaerolineales bacterium]
MNNKFKEDSTNKEKDKPSNRRSFFTGWISTLAKMGLGESLLRLGTNLFSVLAIVVVIILARSYYGQAQGPAGVQEQVENPEGSETVSIESISAVDVAINEGISRSAQIHTNIPSRPRDEMSTYIVQDGDTV